MDPLSQCHDLYMKGYVKSQCGNATSMQNGDVLQDQCELNEDAFSKDDRGIRSKAVITYSASKNNTFYNYLAPYTDLNHAPSNWLRNNIGLRPETVLPRARYTPSSSQIFGGFTMAASHLEHIGKIDIVSDAENIKKLLKMPYSKAHVSMAIHRIGRTLLLEHFDAKRYSSAGSEWKLFREFHQKVAQHQGDNALKKKSASSQHDRLMFSKFLYHSIFKNSLNQLDSKPAVDPSSSSLDEESGEPKVMELDELLKIDQKFAVVSPASCKDPVDDENPSVGSSDRRWRYWTSNENMHSASQIPAEDAFERNIFWTFEDLQMILGTNMPIFGGGKYPAVSLRLRDSQKPINVLTGIDYWLDNLICNVPELVMCFHVNGIVQNYEFIKTEDIPNLKDSNFSPQVVKDIAQNILSFLKSNCTKEGHTYWLFKGSGEDVVKLYDLSTLCHASDQDSRIFNQQNPYSFSVAMLLYKTGINLMQSKDACDHHITVKKLLVQCINLLDHAKYKELISHAICVLSDITLLEFNTKTVASVPVQDGDCDDELLGDKNLCETCMAHQDSGRRSSGVNNPDDELSREIASITNVVDLSIPKKFISMQDHPLKIPLVSLSDDNHMDSLDQPSETQDGSHEALIYIITGFEVLMSSIDKSSSVNALAHLSRNAAFAYSKLAEQSKNNGNLGQALKRVMLALRSYETLQYLDSQRQMPWTDAPEIMLSMLSDFHLLLPNLLSLCGEIQFGIIQCVRANGTVKSSYKEELENWTDCEQKIFASLKMIFNVDGQYRHLTEISADEQSALEKCAQSYQAALNVTASIDLPSTTNPNCNATVLREIRQKGKAMSHKSSTFSMTNSIQCGSSEQLKRMLVRRHGHVVNEIGAFCLNSAVKCLNEDSNKEMPTVEIKKMLKRAEVHFQNAFECFAVVSDAVNQALVLSNTGRLMRVSAQIQSNIENGALSNVQRKCFAAAIEQYQKALSLLNVGKQETSEIDLEVNSCIYDDISWELSGCYFAMAQILQDYTQKDWQAGEKVEREVTSLLINSLKYCEDIWVKSSKQPISLYRQSKIHHRIASLHHNSYRVCSSHDKAKHLHHVANQHYDKSLAILEWLEHPNELLRVQLEKLAMNEYYFNFESDIEKKTKLTIEGLRFICRCRHSLSLVINSLSLPQSGPQRCGKNGNASGSEVDVDYVRDITGLIRAMIKILQSYLLSLVKLHTSENSLLSRKGESVKQEFKELYRKTLVSLQHVTSSSFDVSTQHLYCNAASVVDVLCEISSTLIKL